MLLNCYWFLSNRQMFFNESLPFEIMNDHFSTNHYLFDFSKGFNGSTMVLAFIPLFVFKSVMNDYLMKLISFIRYSFRKEKPAFTYYIDGKYCFKDGVNINENLPDYFRVLQGIDQKRMYTKELYLRSLNVVQYSDASLELLRTSKRDSHKRWLNNIVNYDILSNFVMADKVVYTTMDLRDSMTEQETSDIVARILFYGEERLDWKRDEEYEAACRIQSTELTLARERQSHNGKSSKNFHRHLTKQATKLKHAMQQQVENLQEDLGEAAEGLEL